MARRKPTDIVQLRLRIPEGLRVLLAAEARKRKLSLNKEVVRRLEKSFEREMNEVMFDLIAINAVDTAYARIGLSKPSEMVDLIRHKLGDQAAQTFKNLSSEKESDK